MKPMQSLLIIVVGVATGLIHADMPVTPVVTAPQPMMLPAGKAVVQLPSQQAPQTSALGISAANPLVKFFGTPDLPTRTPSY